MLCLQTSQLKAKFLRYRASKPAPELVADLLARWNLAYHALSSDELATYQLRTGLQPGLS